MTTGILYPRVAVLDRRRNRPLARADVVLPEQKIAMEYDGSWRDGELWALNRDRDRLNRIQAAG